MNAAPFQGMATVAGGPPMAMQAQGHSNLQQLIIDTLKQQPRPPGWQTSVAVEERALKILQL